MTQPTSADPGVAAPSAEQSGEPGEATTITAILAGYAAAGYDGEMMVTRESQIRCRSCDHTMDPASVQLDSLRRVEGASDPDDLQAVVALTCANCGARGALVVAYGPNGSAEDADVLAALPDNRQESGLPDNQPPAGETTMESER